MFPEIVYVRHIMSMLQSRLEICRQNEDGYTTEAIIATALLALLAIGAVGIIATKVMAKANDIQTQ